MKPIDYRNATWQTVLDRVTGLREAVYQGYRDHGPCTTAELAAKIGISVLTVRPRTTELYQAGLVDVTDDPGPEGKYYALSQAAARARFADKRAAALGTPVQLTIPLDLGSLPPVTD
jgi:predicted ArsR family transcriptional regulator